MCGWHLQDECHLCQIHCQRREERQVGSNFHFLSITTFQRDYEFKPLEADEDKGLKFDRYICLVSRVLEFESHGLWYITTFAINANHLSLYRIDFTKLNHIKLYNKYCTRIIKPALTHSLMRCYSI